ASVYALNADFDNPKDGRLLTAFSGKIENNGVHYIDVKDQVYLTSGEKFSVVIESNNDSSYMSFSSSLLTNQNCKENNSYILSHNQWSDAYNQPDISRAYASIKAFTSDLDNSEVTENLKKAVS
ncbi:lectin like domain-containing protein, partial [Ruminococcus sp.]